MGKIIKTKAGSFQLTVNDINGKRIRKAFSLKKDATAFMSKIENLKHQQMLENNNLKKKRITFETAIKDFLNSKNSLSAKSITKYNFTMKQFGHFLDYHKIKYLDEFTSDHATSLQTELMKENTDSKGKEVSASPKTINGFMSTIKAMFNDELNKEHITRNPLIHINNLKEHKPRPEYYTTEELNKFFSIEMKDEYRAAFLGLLYTGVRFGELANITWDDINLERKLLFIRPQKDHALKTNNSERAIPMNEKLFELLAARSENKKSSIYPFCSAEGKQLRERRLLEIVKSIASKAGITSRVFIHKFRHTFATTLIP